MNNFWKKFATIIFSGMTFLTMALPYCYAAPLYNSDLEARVTLDPSLKPDNSPGVIISQDTLKKSGSEAYFGNYLLQVLAGALITVAAPVAIIIIAVAGLTAVISHGNQAIIDKAKKTLTRAIIGLVIIIFSWVIIRTVISVVMTTNTNQPTTSSSSTGAAPGSGAGSTPGSSSTSG